MSDKKTAVINISKGLLNVSLSTLAAIGSATGNIWLAGASALPSALLASGTLKPLLEKSKEEYLELPIPPWWTEGDRAWQSVCSNIESQLPAIIDAVAQRLRSTSMLPDPPHVRQLFTEEVARHLSWEVPAQERGLVAGYVTAPLLEKSAQTLKEIIEPIRQDALWQLLTHIATMLDEAKHARMALPTQPSGLIAPATTSIETQPGSSVVPSAALSLEQKREAEAYDVYIVYHEADEAEVMHIGKQLKGYGLLPWFDNIDVRPGLPARLQQEQQIERIPAAAICVGTHPILDWQALQMYSFLEQFVQRRCPIIPVLLPGSIQPLKLPPFLSNFGWVDFRKAEPEPIGQLIWGITGKRMHMDK
jgi:hypothetical protein